MHIVLLVAIRGHCDEAVFDFSSFHSLLLHHFLLRSHQEFVKVKGAGIQLELNE